MDKARKVETLNNIDRKQEQSDATVAPLSLRTEGLTEGEIEYMFLNPMAEGQCKWPMKPGRFLMIDESPPVKRTDCVKRHIVEFCCGPDSKIGNKKDLKNGLSVTQVTEGDDVTTTQGCKAGKLPPVGINALRCGVALATYKC